MQNAITREKKEEIVGKLKGKLQDSAIVFGMRFKGLDVSAFGRLMAKSVMRHAWGDAGHAAHHLLRSWQQSKQPCRLQ